MLTLNRRRMTPPPSSALEPEDLEAELWALRFQLQARETEVQQLRARVDAQALQLETLQEYLNGADDDAEDMMLHRSAAGSRTVASVAQEPALCIAASHGDADTVCALLSADPDVLRADGDAALLIACQHGHLPVVAALLDQGASVHADYDSALLWAVRRRDQDLARLLLQYGADPGALNRCSLRLATQIEDAGMVRLLAGALRQATKAPQL